jgi:NADH:ubiquinone oxidoreductase subunit 6 (subunit J)
MPSRTSVTATVVIVGLLVGELLALLRYTPRRIAAELAQAAGFGDPRVVFAAGDLARRESEVRGVVGSIAAPLFQTYLVPFEITSILLLAAIVGAVVLAKRKA